MILSAVGLQTHIWNNNLKSLLLLICFPALILLMMFGGAMIYFYNYFDAYYRSLDFIKANWYTVFTAVLAWFTLAFFFHQSFVNLMSGGRLANRNSYTRIYNLLENLCISRGITMPKLFIINNSALNAFASGLGKKTYSITLTQGLIDNLDDEELEAVLGHELTHIINHDTRLLIVCVIFVGTIAFFAKIIFSRRGLRLLRGLKGRDEIIVLIIAVVSIPGYLIASLLRCSLSRKREYLADAGSVELTKNPDAIIRALQKISGHAAIAKMPSDISQMCIERTEPKSSFFGLFASHPPIEDRIEALQQYAGAAKN